MKQISLTKGKLALVDNEDYENLNRFKWHCNSSGYAVRDIYIKQKEGKSKRKNIPMHRLINNTPDDLYTDHINGNPLDNRRSNLRNCTKSQNGMNSKSPKGAASKYKGVSWYNKGKKWCARIQIERKRTCLGLFVSEIEAAKAYNKAAIGFYGEFARLNELPQPPKTEEE